MCIRTNHFIEIEVITLMIQQADILHLRVDYHNQIEKTFHKLLAKHSLQELQQN